MSHQNLELDWKGYLLDLHNLHMGNHQHWTPGIFLKVSASENYMKKVIPLFIESIISLKNVFISAIVFIYICVYSKSCPAACNIENIYY